MYHEEIKVGKIDDVQII